MFNFDFAENEPTENFLLQAGYYTGVIQKVSEKFTQRGSRMIQCQIKITGQIIDGAATPLPFHGTIAHNLVFPTLSDDESKRGFMLNRIRLFLKLIGEPYKGNANIDITRWVGREVAFKVKRGQYNGETQHQIHYFMSHENAMKASVDQQRGDFIDDVPDERIPF